MICPACAHANEENANFCLKCGARLVLVCPQCEKVLPPDAQFCSQCGARLGSQSPQGRAPQPPTPSPQPPAPTSFCDGRYEVKRFLGEGGKKRVYLAHDTKLDRDVAFALIKTDGLDDVGRERIRREAQAMGRLGAHPHIVSVFDLGEEAGQPYIVTELMGGGDVEGLIEKAPEHRVPLADALRIADEVCRGLDFAHAHNIVHRDLKPGNVWMTADPSAGSGHARAKLGDFGLAVATDRARLTQAGLMVGTVSYMPPEQALGGEVTARSDLYSLGAMLYEMVTGRPPFVGDESVAIITQHLNTPPVAPSWHVPNLPPGLEAVILRLLEKDASKRPASAAEVQDLLAAGARPHPSVSAVSQAPTPSPQNPLYRHTFVGREAEMGQLDRAFDRVLGGEGSLVAVVGEPGIGKTALCEQLATYVAVRGGKALVGHCYEEGSLSLPYLPFIEALRSYVLARDPEGLQRDLGSGAGEVARIISEIRDRLPPQHSALSTQHSTDPDEDRWRLYQALAGFLRNASTVQPLLIILEDLHWADRGTLDLLVYLSHQLSGTRVLLVGNYRDVEVDRAHPLSGALAELRRGSAFLRVPLRGLTADEVQRMMTAIAGQEVSWSLAEAVYRQTEGNPLFVQEVLRYLAEEGLVQREDGHWQRTGPLEEHIPEGLRDVIGKRLSRLSDECNRVLALASVIGRDFDLRPLQLVAGGDEDTLISALEEALRVGVLDEQSRPGSVRYRFTHAFFRQTLYEELSAARRLRLHQQVARALEQQYAARIEEHAAELAEHFAHSTDAEDLRKAVHYGELAARRALAVYAFGEAARHLAQAIEVQEVLDPGEGAKRCDLLLDLGEALGPSGDPHRATEEVAPRAWALAEDLGDRVRMARCCMMALDATRRYARGLAGMSAEIRLWGNRLRDCASPGTVAEIVVETSASSPLLNAWRWAEGNAAVDRAMAVARSLGDPTWLIRAAINRLVANRVSPRQQVEALELADELIRIPRDGVPSWDVFRLFQVSQYVYLLAGHRARAEELWRELDAIAARDQDPLWALWPLERETIQATLDGNIEGSLAAAERMATRSEEIGSPVAGRHFAGVSGFWPLIWLGRAEEARQSINRGNQMMGNARTTMRPGRNAICLAHLGRINEARAELTKIMAEGHIGKEDDGMFAQILVELLYAAVLVEDCEAAALLSTRLDSIMGAGSFVPWNVARARGKAAALNGDAAAAHALYRQSLEWASQLRFRPEIALSHLEIAELLFHEAVSYQPSAVSPGADAGGQAEKLVADKLKADGSAHLDFAIEEFRAMKMQPYLERALRHKGLLHA